MATCVLLLEWWQQRETECLFSTTLCVVSKMMQLKWKMTKVIFGCNDSSRRSFVEHSRRQDQIKCLWSNLALKVHLVSHHFWACNFTFTNSQKVCSFQCSAQTIEHDRSIQSVCDCELFASNIVNLWLMTKTKEWTMCSKLLELFLRLLLWKQSWQLKSIVQKRLFASFCQQVHLQLQNLKKGRCKACWSLKQSEWSVCNNVMIWMIVSMAMIMLTKQRFPPSTFCLTHPGLGLIIMSWMFHGCFRNGHSNVNIWWPKIGSLWLFVVNHRLNFKPSTGLTALLGYPIYVPGFHDVLGSRFFSESSYDFTVQKSHTNFQNVCQSLISYYLCRETKSFYFNTRSTADAFPFFRRRSYALTGKGHLRINNDLSITLRKFHCATSLGACEQKWYNNCTSCTGSLVP